MFTSRMLAYSGTSWGCFKHKMWYLTVSRQVMSLLCSHLVCWRIQEHLGAVLNIKCGI